MNKEYIHKDTRTDEPLQVQIETLTRWQDPTIEEYKKEIERLNNIINELENGLKEEIDRLEKVALENKNNKFEFDKLVLIRGKVMDIYDELKELKGGK